MEAALKRAYHDLDITPPSRAGWWYWVYVDDCTFQAESIDLLPIFGAIYRALNFYKMAPLPRERIVHLPAHADEGAPHVLQWASSFEGPMLAPTAPPRYTQTGHAQYSRSRAGPLRRSHLARAIQAMLAHNPSGRCTPACLDDGHRDCLP